MADIVNRTELQAIRDYVQDNRDDVLELVMRQAPSLKYFTRYEGVIGELLLEWNDIQDVVKPWACDFSPDPDLIDRKPISIRSYFQKAEARFCPKNDFFTYKGYLAQTKQNPRDYPYARWAIEHLLAPKIRQQLEFQQLFTGTRVNPPTAASEMYDGLLTIIAADLASGTPILTPVTTGVLTAANIIDQVEQMDDAIDEKYKTSMMAMRCAPEIFKMYRRAYRAAAGFHPDNPTTNSEDVVTEITIDGSTTKLVSCPGMTGSQRLILTPINNTYYAYDDPSDDQVFEFFQQHRYLDMWCDFWGGTGFLIFDPRILYVNDQA